MIVLLLWAPIEVKIAGFQQNECRGKFHYTGVKAVMYTLMSFAMVQKSCEGQSVNQGLF